MKQIFLGVIAVLIFVSVFFGWYNYFSWLAYATGFGIVGTLGYLMYTQGFFIRLYPKIWSRDGSWEVRKFIKPTRLKESYMVMHERCDLIPQLESSSLYLMDRVEWKCLDILRIVLENGKVPHLPRILILGSGGGSFINTLLKKYKGAIIDAVEISPEVIWIARNYFLKQADLSNVRIFKDDGVGYLKDINKNDLKYDILIIDMFLQTSVPSSIFDTSFINKIKATLKRKGILFVNFGIAGTSNIDTLKIKEKYGKSIKNMSLYLMGRNVIGTNVRLRRKVGSYVNI